MKWIILLAFIGCLANCNVARADDLNKKADRPAVNLQTGGNFDISSDDISNADSGEDNNVILLNYDPIDPKPTSYVTSVRNLNNKIKPDSYIGSSDRDSTGNKKSSSVVIPNVREVMSSEASDQQEQASNADRIRDIAMNSREVRLVGPNQREVEMKGDLPTKIVVAMENLQKEASDVWGQVNEKLDSAWTDLKRSEVVGQVNEKLDKGWTDLKSMIEGVVSPSTKQANRKVN